MTDAYQEIFTPSGIPKITYVARVKFENELNNARSSSKFVIVTGMTKSGKTILTQKIFPQNETIWIQGGSIIDSDSFWENLLVEYDSYTDSKKTTIETNEKTLEVNGEAGLNWFVKFKLLIRNRLSLKKSKGLTLARYTSKKTAALKSIQMKRTPIVIDDFHYIPKGTQKEIIRAFKNLVLNRIPVVFVAIPHREFDAILSEREITGRTTHIKITPWSFDELIQIPKKGFDNLNVEMADSILNQLVEESYGTPNLMQEFCKKICELFDVKNKQEIRRKIAELDQRKLFCEIARENGKAIFDKLKAGVRSKGTKRKERTLKTGVKTDLYGVILEALRKFKPTVGTISFSKLRDEIGKVLEDPVPPRDQISNVLKQMSKISLDASASSPVVDWELDQDRLHITDPFFVFYLKWSED